MRAWRLCGVLLALLSCILAAEARHSKPHVPVVPTGIDKLNPTFVVRARACARARARVCVCVVVGVRVYLCACVFTCVRALA